MRSQKAERILAKGTSSVVESLVGRVRSARKEGWAHRRRFFMGKRGPSVEERCSELSDFCERYEELVEAVCDAAQYGPNPKLERVYGAERNWVRERYRTIRPFLIGYLQMELEDAEVGLAAGGPPTDAFEALLTADSLDGLLRIDDGCMISRITRTREALVLYGEHLRQLAARTA